MYLFRFLNHCRFLCSIYLFFKGHFSLKNRWEKCQQLFQTYKVQHLYKCLEDLRNSLWVALFYVLGLNLLIKYIYNIYKGRHRTLLLNLCIQKLKLRYINRQYHLMNGLCMYKQESGELMKNCYNQVTFFMMHYILIFFFNK